MHNAPSSFPQAFLQTFVVLHKVVLIFISVRSKIHEAGQKQSWGCGEILPGQCGQHESWDLIGLWQSRGGHTSVSHRTRPLWQVHCVHESMFHVSPSTKYSPPGARHTDASLSSGLWEPDSSRQETLHFSTFHYFFFPDTKGWTKNTS